MRPFQGTRNELYQGTGKGLHRVETEFPGYLSYVRLGYRLHPVII